MIKHLLQTISSTGLWCLLKFTPPLLFQELYSLSVLSYYIIYIYIYIFFFFSPFLSSFEGSGMVLGVIEWG